jgi:hypothetical protein
MLSNYLNNNASKKDSKFEIYNLATKTEHKTR